MSKNRRSIINPIYCKILVEVSEKSFARKHRQQIFPNQQKRYQMKYIFAILMLVTYSCNQKREYIVAVYLNDHNT